jgi:hypothetical protein
MKLIRILTFSFNLLLLTSCKTDSLKENPFTINVNNYSKDAIMTDIFTSIKAINLELNENSIIGNYKKYIIFDTCIFILDISDHSIVTFNLEGKFISRLKKKGKGPNEYPEIKDFDINPFDSTIDIMTSIGSVYKYHFNGDFYDKYAIPDTKAVHYIANYSKDLVAFYTDLSGERLTLYSTRENRILRRFHTHPEYAIGVGLSPFYKYKDSILLREAFGSCIYYLNQTKLEPFHCFDFKGRSIEPDEITEFGPEKLLKEFTTLELEKMYKLWTTESIEFLISSFKFKSDIFTYIYNKQDTTGILIKKFKNGSGFFYNPTLYNNLLYALIPANYLNLYINDHVRRDFKISSLDSINEYSNPILIISDLKK